ncbi:MAG: SIR2 family protein [Desulfomonilaceae bacterium]
MHTRNETNHNQELRLVDYLVRGKIVPFIGSGLSCNVDLPSWSNVVTSMEKEIGHLDAEEFFDTAQRFQDTAGRPELIRLLDRELSLKCVNIQKLDIHHALLDFPFLDFFTTNQDLVLETVLADLHIPHVPIRSHKDLREAKSRVFPRIVKFHGDLVATDEIVFTRQDMHRRTEAPHPFDIYLQGRLIENAILFIGYGLNDPNVAAVWKRVQHYSAAGCKPVGFCLMIERDERVIERMLEFGIEPVVVPVADRKNPVELLEWLHGIRYKAHESFYRASMEYLFHGTLAPAQTLTRSQLQVLAKKLEAGGSPDELLKKTTYFQRVPLTLQQDVQDLLLRYMEVLSDFIWLWEIAHKERMDGLAIAVLHEMRRRQLTSRSAMREDSYNQSIISQDFDEWTMKILMAHLKALAAETNRDQAFDLHVSNIFRVIDRRLGTFPLGREVKQEFESLKRSYGGKYLGIWFSPEFSTTPPSPEKRMMTNLRRAHVTVPDDRDKREGQQ